jgi:hypothetical protein
MIFFEDDTSKYDTVSSILLLIGLTTIRRKRKEKKRKEKKRKRQNKR